MAQIHLWQFLRSAKTAITNFAKDIFETWNVIVNSIVNDEMYFINQSLILMSIILVLSCFVFCMIKTNLHTLSIPGMLVLSQLLLAANEFFIECEHQKKNIENFFIIFHYYITWFCVDLTYIK
ncbi:hypothetical protein EDEG_02468 [Edhazardia aedis USNM 41457]|uniref:Uncharacterized protein n=1 Tax=Edhazardia aedis (strain USNM 41457) TaxID=1003232 RepID=J8ZU33_EDHAE|nr:hypothetical protein EDEG_02468 [Edhazardia aedis USNM 41457]|eukprot:EJW03163.1 hypothetical protein EDEG_02468 [Edhazardia aedis USNM 41457]